MEMVVKQIVSGSCPSVASERAKIGFRHHMQLTFESKNTEMPSLADRVEQNGFCRQLFLSVQ